MNRIDFEAYYQKAAPIRVSREAVERLKPLRVYGLKKEDIINHTDITPKQVREDLALFFELLRYCYSGYSYYLEGKIEPEAKIEEILELLPDTAITTFALADAVCQVLSPYINDSHFAFASDHRTSLAKIFQAYFSDVVVCACEGGYRVENGSPQIPAGHLFAKEEAEAYLFETLPGEDGRRRYLLGVYTPEEASEITVGGIALPLHRCKTDSVCPEPQQGAAWEEERDGIPVVYHDTYSAKDIALSFEDYRKSGMRYRDSDLLVWSLLSNTGGHSGYPQNFVLGLNGYACWEMDVAMLSGPFTGKAEAQEIRYEVYENEKIDLSRSEYEGKLFVLQNKRVMSSGESALYFARSVKHVTFVGSASGGCGQFGDIGIYRLPNTGLAFQMGYKVFNNENFEEGRGLLPDYWLDSSDPVGEVVRYLRTR